MNEGYLNFKYFENVEPHMKELEAAQVWTILERETCPNYRLGSEGMCYVLQMREGKNYVIEKIQAQWK